MKLNIRGPAPAPKGSSSGTSSSGGSSSKEKTPAKGSSPTVDSEEDFSISGPTVQEQAANTQPIATSAQNDPMEVDVDVAANRRQQTRDSTPIKRLSPEHRAFLISKIKELKSELYTCTVLGMDDPDSPEGRVFVNATKKLERLKKSFKLLFEDDEVLVPNEAPYFQWEGMIFNEDRAYFKTVEDCIERFERVLTAYRVDIEDNWKRILPARLVGAVARWYATLEDIATWDEFKTVIIRKYGRPQSDIKEEAREKLENLVYDKRSSFSLFIEEFQELKAAADIKDEDCLVRYLFKALPEDLSAATKFYINNATNIGEIDINFAISKVLATYEALFKAKWANETSRTSVNRNTNTHQGYNFRGGEGSHNKYKRRSTEDSKEGSKTPRLSCKYHPGLTNHSEADCVLPSEVKKNMEKAYKKYGRDVKFCNRCKAANYKEGHNCKPDDLAKLKKNIKVITEKKKTIVPVISDDDSEDGHDNESSMTFAALSLNDKNVDCKFDECDFSQPPKDLMKNNSIILPITLESSGCTIKTYFLLDTGASFSCISPTLAHKLHVNLNKTDLFGVIKTCQKDNVVKRMGCTDEKIKLTYNSRECHANLEVFNIFSDLHVVIGMDLISQLGITISNLAMDWDDDNNVEIPPIDPNPYTPNDQPYGTDEERQRLLDEVMPLLEANKNIDPKAHCTLPGSIFRLHVLEEEKPKMYRAQWPLEEKVKPAVKAQIAKWLENGVIERAPPGNPYNSPLFPVRKKDAQGEYSGDSRIVMDCRLVNLALDPAKSDRFPLPLISELHRKMSKHSIYTIVDLSQCFHSFAVHPSSRPYLSFTDPTTGLQYMHAKAPMGLMPLSSFVQRQLSNLFSDLNEVTTNFIDDITVHTVDDIDLHIKYVKIVIERLTKANLTINIAKTHLAQKSINILGFCLSKKGLTLDQRKVSNIVDWNPVVKTSKELASRLGLINFFRSHLPCLSTLTAPLDAIKNSPDLSQVWTDAHTETMKKIQLLLANAPVLSAPNMAYDMHLVTDSSACGIGACLYQVIKKRVYYLGFIARKLTPCEMRWGSTKRELLAVVYAFKKYRQWLWGNKFHLYVDNKGLLYLHSQEKLTRVIENFYETIFELSFDITFCAGIHNILADRLSRIFEHRTKKLEGSGGMARRATIIQKRKSIDDNIEEENSNKKIKSIEDNQQKVSEDSVLDATEADEQIDTNKEDIDAPSKDENKDTIQLDNIDVENTDLFIYASHLEIYQQPKDEEEKKTLLEKAHLLGHFGISAMEQVIHEEYQMHWTGLRKDIESYVKNCSKCRVFNLGRHVYHPPRNIIPNGVFDHIVMDLGTFEVTTPRGNNFMLLVMDLFSRFIILRAIPDKLATTIAKELVGIWSLMGYSKVISHDNGKEFSNQLLEAISAQAGIEQRLSLPYSPVGNANAEAGIRSAKLIIMKMLEGRSENWDLYLDGTAYCLNLHKSRLHGMMPFVVVFARLPNELIDYSHIKPVFPDQEVDIKALKQKLKLIDKILVPAIRGQIVKTKESDNAYFRKKHKILEKPFPIGSSVMIKNVEKNKKTDPNYEGPYTVYGHTKNGSYILQDKTDAFLSRDVPTSHIKLISERGLLPEEQQNNFVVQAILNHKGEAPNHEYLVRWEGYDSNWDSWEPPSMFDAKDAIELYWARRNAGQKVDVKGKGRKKAAPKSVNTRKIQSRQERSVRRNARIAATRK